MIKNKKSYIDILFEKWSKKFIEEKKYSEDDFFKLFEKIRNEALNDSKRPVGLYRFLDKLLREKFDTIKESKMIKNRKIIKENKKIFDKFDKVSQELGLKKGDVIIMKDNVDKLKKGTKYTVVRNKIYDEFTLHDGILPITYAVNASDIKNKFSRVNSIKENKMIKNRKVIKEAEEPKKSIKKPDLGSKQQRVQQIDGQNIPPTNKIVIPTPPPEVNTYKAMTEINKSIESCKKLVDEFMKVQAALAPLVVFTNEKNQSEFNEKINEKLELSYNALQSLIKYLISVYTRKVVMNENKTGLDKLNKLILEDLYTDGQALMKPLMQKTTNSFDRMLSELRMVIVHSDKSGYKNTSRKFDELHQKLARVKGNLYDYVDKNELKK